MNYRVLRLLTVFILIFSIESSLLFQKVEAPPTEINFPVKVFGKVATSIKAEVYDSEGRLRTVVYKDNDLITNNFRNFLISFFTTTTSPAVSSVVLKDTTNTDRTIQTRIQATTVANYFVDSASGSSSKGGSIGIGSGTTAPAVTNYGLETQYGSSVQVSNGYPTWNTASGNVTITGTVAITGNVQISEGSVFVNWIPSAGTTVYSICMTHDTFTPISCINGDTFVLTVVLQLSSDMTDNFGRILTGVFTYVADGGTVQFNNYDDTGGTITMYSYYPSTSSAVINHFSSIVGTLSSGVKIGTSSASTARAMYNVQTPVEIITAITPTPSIDGSNNLVIISDIVCVSERYITEGGFFMSQANSAVSQFYTLLWRCTTSTIHIPAGSSIRVKFVITL